jgi:RNA recognition motif-containing protein
VFISNLQWWTTDAEVEQLCAAYGHIVNIRFIDDKACGKSRGMAIAEFAESDAATNCIAGLNGCVPSRLPDTSRRSGISTPLDSCAGGADQVAVVAQLAACEHACMHAHVPAMCTLPIPNHS